MTDKEQIIIDGIDIGKCTFSILYLGNIVCGTMSDVTPKPKCSKYPNCFFKQLARKTQECEELSILAQEESARNGLIEYELNDKLKQKTQEYENLKAEEKYLKQCCQKAGEELAKHSFDYDGKEKNLVIQAMELNEKYEKFENALEENEELKKEIINKNEKIKELRFSVSDLTNRLCYLNAEKSFRIVDLEQALEEIEEVINNILNSCLGRNTVGCRPTHNVCGDLINILNIINKVKDGKNDNSININ